MRRLALLLAFAFVLLAAPNLSAQQLDSAATAVLDSRLDEYFAALETEPVSVKIAECDFMLESCTDPLVRQYVAVRIYDHFLGSKVMGDEAVAVHMVDDWFAAGKVDMYSEIDKINAEVYAQFHRSSLIGMHAPFLDLRTRDGEIVTAPARGEVSVLFFYDTSCSKCKLETMMLRQVLQEIDIPVEFFAINTGVYREEWDFFIESRWNFEAPNVNIHHLWDPEFDTGFQMQYGVLQTPQMVLVDAEGVIVGRNLDSQALVTLLSSIAPSPYEYGNSEAMDMLSSVFSGDSPTAAHLLETAEYIKEHSLAQGDSTLCRHMLGDFLYYLMDTPGQESKLALSSFIKEYIDSDPGMWTGPEDEARVLIPAAVAADLLGRVPVGSRIPSLKLYGKFGRDGQLKYRRADKIRGNPGYVLFYDPSCASCQAEISAIDAVIESSPKAKVFVVNPEDNGREILDAFDLSTLPFIIRTDKKGHVTGKYISFL